MRRVCDVTETDANVTVPKMSSAKAQEAEIINTNDMQEMQYIWIRSFSLIEHKPNYSPRMLFNEYLYHSLLVRE